MKNGIRDINDNGFTQTEKQTTYIKVVVYLLGQ